jgi:glutaminyl-peptide cyclotransferase
MRDPGKDCRRRTAGKTRPVEVQSSMKTEARAHRALASSICVCLLWLATQAARADDAAVPMYTYQVVHTYPHDSSAFTQGLFFLDGYLYESTGLLGRSSIRKVRFETGEVLQQKTLPPEYFGEGITYWGKRIIGLTWRSQVGFVFNLSTFSLEKRWEYPGEGWGITRNDKALIMSDGTAELRWLNPLTLKELRRVTVTSRGKPVDQLNELEWVKGEIFANIWQTNLIARIDPSTGKVTGFINLTGLLSERESRGSHPDVLNGIAYDAAGDRLFVTGKLWPKLYEIQLVKVGP